MKLGRFKPLLAADDGTDVTQAPAAAEPAQQTPDTDSQAQTPAAPSSLRDATAQLQQMAQQNGVTDDTSTDFAGSENAGAGEQALQEATQQAKAAGISDDQIAQAQQAVANGEAPQALAGPDGQQQASQEGQTNPLSGPDGLVDGQQNPAAQDAEVIAAQQAQTQQSLSNSLEDLLSRLEGGMQDADDDEPDVPPVGEAEPSRDGQEDQPEELDMDAALEQFQENPMDFLNRRDEAVRQQTIQDVLNSPEIQAAVNMAQESQQRKSARQNIQNYVQSVAGDDPDAQNAFAARYGNGIQQNWDAANSVPDAQRPLMIAHQAAIIGELQSQPSLAALSADPANWDKVAGDDGLMEAMLSNPAVIQKVLANDGIRRQMIGSYTQELQDGAKPAVLTSGDSTAQIQATPKEEPQSMREATRAAIASSRRNMG